MAKIQSVINDYSSIQKIEIILRLTTYLLDK